MYTKPTHADEQLEHWGKVLEDTKDDPSMLAYYAFHGAKNDVSTALTYLNSVKDSKNVNPQWLDQLHSLSEIRRKV